MGMLRDLICAEGSKTMAEELGFLGAGEDALGQCNFSIRAP